MTEPANEIRTLDQGFLAILRCPMDRAPLRAEIEALICTKCGRRYPINDGIPDMLGPTDDDGPMP